MFFILVLVVFGGYVGLGVIFWDEVVEGGLRIQMLERRTFGGRL